MSDAMRIFDPHAWHLHRARAQARFAEHDFLMRRTAEDMADRLGLIQRDFPSAVNLGAHTALLQEALTEYDAQTRVSALRAEPLPSDGAPLPLAAESTALITALLNLHHINDLPGLLIQARRALKPDGLFLGTLFGGDTLTELRQAFVHAEAEVEGGASPRIAPFASVQDMGSLLQRAGFALPVVDTDMITVTYEHPLKLMAELRGMGETNILRARRKSFSRRATFLRTCEIYQERFGLANGRIPATFEILTITGWAPHASQQKPLKPGSADVSLTKVLGTDDNK